MSAFESGAQRPSGVIVAFSPGSIKTFEQSSVGAVVRRKIPTLKPDRLFIYSNSPASAIVGYAEIKDLRMVSLPEATSLSSSLGMTPSAISAYFGQRDKLGLYQLSNIKMFSSPITRDEVSSIMSFHPPQNFLLIKPEAVERLIEFSNAHSANNCRLAL